MIGNILDNITDLYMIKYTFGEIFSSGGATLCKNPSYQTVSPIIPNNKNNKNSLNGKYLSDCRTVSHFYYSKTQQKSNIEDAMWDYTTDILSTAT